MSPQVHAAFRMKVQLNRGYSDSFSSPKTLTGNAGVIFHPTPDMEQLCFLIVGKMCFVQRVRCLGSFAATGNLQRLLIDISDSLGPNLSCKDTKRSTHIPTVLRRYERSCHSIGLAKFLSELGDV